MAASTVLIADDDDEVRELVRDLLEGNGYDVIEASDGHAAWRLLLERRPDLAILDVGMPGLNGIELARDIAAEAHLKHTRVMVLTGADPLDLKKAGESQRIDVYLQKPFAPSVLRQAVASELAR